MLDRLKNSVARAMVWAANTITTSQELEKVLLQDHGTLAGVSVSHDSAMRVSTVYQCVTLLANSVAQVPLKVYRRGVDGSREEDRDHPLYRLLHDKPNSVHTSYEWRQIMQSHLALRGNAYSFLNKVGTKQRIAEIIPLHPDGVTVKTDDFMRPRYEYSDGSGQKVTYDASQILHLRNLSMGSDFVKGISPIRLHRESIGTAMAANNHGAMSLGNGAKPGGILSNDVVLQDKQAERLIKQFEDQAAGLKSGGTAVMDGGWKYTPVAMTNRDAQFIEILKYSVNDIATRIFNIPAHMAGDLDRATFSNITEQSIGFVRNTMGPWFSNWEQRLSCDLMPMGSRHYVRFELGALMRGTPKERAEFYQVMRQIEAMSANEVRAKEEMNPRPGGDDFSNPAINPTESNDDSEQDEESV